MTEHFAVLLQGVVDNPQQPINTLPLMTAAEQLQLQAWNQTQTKYPNDKTLVDLFEAQVALLVRLNETVSCSDNGFVVFPSLFSHESDKSG